MQIVGEYQQNQGSADPDNRGAQETVARRAPAARVGHDKEQDCAGRINRDVIVIPGVTLENSEGGVLDNPRHNPQREYPRLYQHRPAHVGESRCPEPPSCPKTEETKQGDESSQFVGLVGIFPSPRPAVGVVVEAGVPDKFLVIVQVSYCFGVDLFLEIRICGGVVDGAEKSRGYRCQRQGSVNAVRTALPDADLCSERGGGGVMD